MSREVDAEHPQGRDLRALVAGQDGGRLTVPVALGIVDQLAEALDQLHQRRPAGVVGTLGPDRVVVTSDGRIALVERDAVERDAEVSDRTWSAPGDGFAAPETAGTDALTPAADVFSLAALSVFLLTGVAPTLGTAWAETLVDNDLARLQRVVRRGLSWDPLARPWRASDYARLLRDATEVEVPTGTITLLLVAPDARSDSAERSGETSAATDDVASAVSRLEAAGGRPVTTAVLPDRCALLAFPRAGDAAAAALDVVDGQPVALHAGDLGGGHGATLQQLADETAALLVHAAHDAVLSHDVLVSAPVRMLLSLDDTLVCDPITANCSRLRRVTPGAAAAPGGSLGDRGATWIATRRAGALVGRDRELNTAIEAVERARADDVAPLLMVLGDSGLGKTRFLAELAGRDDDDGGIVLVGRCTESGGAFEPFLDALGDELFPFEAGQLERDEEGWVDRRRFFSRIVDALRVLDRPVTLVLDDVQWIDGSSVALLVQLLDDLGGSLSVAAGCRLGMVPEAVDRLMQRPRTTVVHMRGLDRRSIADLADVGGVPVTAATIDDLSALSGGSPFFAVQLLGHLRDVPDHDFRIDGAHAGVQEWILQRVDRLGDRARDMLAPAAVIGRNFEVVVLADVLGLSPLGALADLDAAVTAGLLVDGEHPGEFRFVHAIVGATLEATLSSTRRALLHAAIARRLEEDGDGLDNLEAVMYHWFAAGRLGDPLHAGDVAADVATRTTERLAHERSVAIIDRALAVLEFAAASPRRARVEARLRLAHGRADFVASRNAAGMEQLWRAADLAESADDPATLAEAALMASLNRRHGRDDPELLALLDRASEICPSDPAVLPAMLHIRRSRLLPASVRHERRAAMARLGLVDIDSMEPVDRATVETEVARACWSPDDATGRLQLMSRIADEASQQLRTGGPSRWTGVLIEALNHRWAARMQLGDLGGALVDADRAAAVADDAGTTFLLSRVMIGQAMIHATMGDHDVAERLANDAVGMSDRHNLMLGHMAITYSIGRDRGQQLELAKLERQMADLVDSNPMFVAAFALVHAEAGQVDDARRLLEMLHEWAPWPRNWLWLATTTAALETTVLIDDLPLVRRYAAVLERYRGQWAMAAGELTCLGPIDRVLGLARMVLGDSERGTSLLTAARDAADLQGAWPWVERCDAALAA